MTDEAFRRAAQRLADNKRYAARNTKIPSLLQGLAACSACGYGYYRTSTRTTNKKTHYRCPGSDDYRYEGGRVCGNKPVRADYPGQVVWDHITGLLADSALIRAEIGKRLEQARTADPAARQRKRLELARAQATTSITRMIEAFSEQLITIDELRARMPGLRARETNLRSQADAIDAQLADRKAYLKLAHDLEGFLAHLRDHTHDASVTEGQRVLRLLVKDILIGPNRSPSGTESRYGNETLPTHSKPPNPRRRVTIAQVIYCVGGVLSRPARTAIPPWGSRLATTTPARTAPGRSQCGRRSWTWDGAAAAVPGCRPGPAAWRRFPPPSAWRPAADVVAVKAGCGLLECGGRGVVDQFAEQRLAAAHA